MNSYTSRDLPTPASPDGDDLATARTGLVEDPAQVLNLGVAVHEAGEAPEGRGLQTRPGLAGSRQLEDLDRI